MSGKSDVRRRRLERAEGRRRRLAELRQAARPAEARTSGGFSLPLWRYRDQLAPLYVGSCVWAAGAGVHQNSAAVLAGLGTAAAGTAAWKVGNRKLRRPEALYATAVTVTAGTWITLAGWLDPSKYNLTAYLAALTLAGGVPWWRHRRVRRRIQVDKTIKAWDSVAEMAGIPGAKLVNVVATGWGWRGVVKTSGVQAGDAVVDPAVLKSLEVGLKLRPGSMRAEASKQFADRAYVTAVDKDPHAEPVPWTGPTITSVKQAFVVGPYEDGEEFSLAMWGPRGMKRVLVGGASDAGKSSLINLVVGEMSACADVLLDLVDLKGGQELRPWRSAADRLATDVPGAKAILRDLEREVNQRGGDAASRVWDPEVDGPVRVLVIDEAAELDDECRGLLASVARMGRATGVGVVIATQYPEVDVVPRQIRGNCNVRACFRLEERGQRRVILNSTTVDPSTIPAARPGTCYLEADGARQLPIRVRYADDDVIDRVAALAGQGWDGASAPDTLPDDLDDSAWDPDGLDPVRDDVPVSDLRTERPDEPVPPSEPDALQALRDALRGDGISPRELKAITGRSNSWVHAQLDELVEAGEAERVSRGVYRATLVHAG